MSEKKVLVNYLNNNKVVKFSKTEELLPAIQSEFGSLIPTADMLHLCVQIKSEKWGGMFVDVAQGKDVPDRSVLRVIIAPSPVVSGLVLI